MKWYNEIINDTLKREKDGQLKWSRTSLTMASAWGFCCGAFVYALITEGFRIDAFTIMVGVALGSKWVDAKSREIEKR